MDNRTRQIKIASWVGIGGNAFLALFKLLAGFLSGSLAVVADGIDSSGDVLISVITLIIAYLLTKPPSLRFPYGYGKAEANATIVLAFIIFFAGAQLAISSVKRFFEVSVNEMPGMLATIAILVSILGKLLLAWYQSHIGKKVKSNMLKANAKNMQGDVVISSSVLIGLILSHVLNLPVLDVVFAFLVSLWVMWVAIRIFIETNMELMDGNIEKPVYEKVFSIVESVPEVKNPHRMRIRRVGHKLMINIDIEMDGSLSIKHAHDISHLVEQKIRDELQYEVFDVIIHIEPVGDHTREEELGISKTALLKNTKRVDKKMS